MPCIKCANGKWKYGQHGRCQFDTLEACKAAAAAIHIQDKGNSMPNYPEIPVEDPMGNMEDMSANPVNPPNPPNVQPIPSDWHDPMCQCFSCKACKP